MFGHHVRFFHYTPFLKKQLNELYFTHYVRRFVFSLFAIFVPIYLLTLGFSVPEVIMFYMAYSASTLVFSFAAGFVSNRLGLKHTMLLGTPAEALYLVLLYLLSTVQIPLSLIALLAGFNIAFYWLPLHSLFARSSDRHRRSLEVARLFSVSQLPTIAGPIIGGFIILAFGFSVLFLVTLLMLFVAVVPLFATPEIKPHVRLRIVHGLDIFRKYPRTFLGSMLLSIGETAEGIIWPIFVYLLFSSTVVIGFVGTLLSVGYVMFALIAGKFSEKVGRKNLMRIGGASAASLWILRVFVSTEIFVYAATLLVGFFSILVIIPFLSGVYDNARKSRSVDEFIIFREIPIFAGRIILLFSALVLAESINLSFLLPGLSFFSFFLL